MDIIEPVGNYISVSLSKAVGEDKVPSPLSSDVEEKEELIEKLVLESESGGMKEASFLQVTSPTDVDSWIPPAPNLLIPSVMYVDEKALREV